MRPERLELSTFGFEAQHSIRLSYGRTASLAWYRSDRYYGKTCGHPFPGGRIQTSLGGVSEGIRTLDLQGHNLTR